MYISRDKYLNIDINKKTHTIGRNERALLLETQ